MCKNMVPLSFLKAAQLLNILQSKMLVYALNFLFCFVKYFAYILRTFCKQNVPKCSAKFGFYLFYFTKFKQKPRIV